MTSQRAHNVVELEGREFDAGDPPEELPVLAAEQFENVAVIRAAGRHAPGGAFDPRQERWLALNSGEWLIVADDMSSFWHREATQWFQLPPGADLEKTDVGFEIKFPWSDLVLRVFNLQPVIGRVAHHGERVQRWLGWYSARYRKLQPSWQIGFRSRGFRHRFVTSLRWVQPRSHWHAPVDGTGTNGFCWQEGAAVEGVRVAWVNEGIRLDPCEH